MKPEQTIQKLKAGNAATIIALGDSLTEGWMVARGYLDFIDEMLRKKYPPARFTIMNRGIPGDTADGGLNRLREDVLDHDPDCVLVQFALNDLFMGISPERYKNHMQAIIDSIQSDTGAEIVVVTSVCLGNRPENAARKLFLSPRCAWATGGKTRRRTCSTVSSRNWRGTDPYASPAFTNTGLGR
jgi:hypothetical protein